MLTVQDEVKATVFVHILIQYKVIVVMSGLQSQHDLLDVDLPVHSTNYRLKAVVKATQVYYYTFHDLNRKVLLALIKY
jgi:hypothetical protein